MSEYVDPSKIKFQSTLPVWGATQRPYIIRHRIAISIHAPRVGSDSKAVYYPPPYRNFNPRSPCGERLYYEIFDYFCAYISIHAPRVGSDITDTSPTRITRNFNPRSPCGERLFDFSRISATIRISIHAPRVGSDFRLFPYICHYKNFNPRSPCGERPGFSVLPESDL